MSTLFKFVSHDYEKLDRSVELHAEYLDKINDSASDGTLSKRLDNGLYALQRVDCLLVNLHAQRDYPNIGKYIKTKFYEQGLELGAVVKTAKESVDMVEPEEANSIVVQKVKEGLSFLEFELQKKD